MTQTTLSAYEQLKQRFREMHLIDAAHSTLFRDAQTAMSMGSNDERMLVLGALSKTCHNLVTGPEVKKLLDKALDEKEQLPLGDQKNLALMHAHWIKESGLPAELVERMAGIRIAGRQKHNREHKNGNWDNMKPTYEASFSIQREAASFQQHAMNMATPYEALLNHYSPTTDPELIDRVFTDLSAALPDLLKQTSARQNANPAIELYGDINTAGKTTEEIDRLKTDALWSKFPMDKQIKLNEIILQNMGYDLNKGRIDWVDGHPNTSGTSEDARIAVWKQADFITTLMAAMHEAGHAIYLQGLPEKWRYQLAGEFFGMSVHETQSMIYEKVAMKSIHFCKYLEKLAREIFELPDDPALDAVNLFKLMNRTSPSFIRVHADDLTYPAHIIVRYNIEKDIINGNAEVEDIPQRWNDSMQQLLGITPANPAEGHMQDVHWPYAAIGYFPSYALGQIGAFQFFEAACEEHPEILEELTEGKFTTLFNWLRENVHSKGSLLTYDELFTQATGRPLEAKPYIRAMYSKINAMGPAPKLTPPSTQKRSFG